MLSRQWLRPLRIDQLKAILVITITIPTVTSNSKLPSTRSILRDKFKKRSNLLVKVGKQVTDINI